MGLIYAKDVNLQLMLFQTPAKNETYRTLENKTFLQFYKWKRDSSKKHEQSFKPKNAIFSPFHEKFTMQLSSEKKSKWKDFISYFSFEMISRWEENTTLC